MKTKEEIAEMADDFIKHLIFTADFDPCRNAHISGLRVGYQKGASDIQAYADQECAAMTDKLLEAEERIAEIKKVYYLINNGNLNQEGLTLYHAIGEIIFNRQTSLSQKFINQTAVPDSTEK